MLSVFQCLQEEDFFELTNNPVDLAVFHTFGITFFVCVCRGAGYLHHRLNSGVFRSWSADSGAAAALRLFLQVKQKQTQ